MLGVNGEDQFQRDRSRRLDLELQASRLNSFDCYFCLEVGLLFVALNATRISQQDPLIGDDAEDFKRINAVSDTCSRACSGHRLSNWRRILASRKVGRAGKTLSKGTVTVTIA